MNGQERLGAVTDWRRIDVTVNTRWDPETERGQSWKNWINPSEFYNIVINNNIVPRLICLDFPMVM